MASISIFISINHMETLDHIISRVCLRFSTYHLMPRGRKKHLKSANFAFADGRNQTRAACAASEWAILYTIASWQEPLRCYFSHHHFVTLAGSDITTTSKVINLSISSYFSYQTINTERIINVKSKNLTRVLFKMITIDSVTLDRIKTKHFVFCLLFSF